MAYIHCIYATFGVNPSDTQGFLSSSSSLYLELVDNIPCILSTKEWRVIQLVLRTDNTIDLVLQPNEAGRHDYIMPVGFYSPEGDAVCWFTDVLCFVNLLMTTIHI